MSTTILVEPRQSFADYYLLLPVLKLKDDGTMIWKARSLALVIAVGLVLAVTPTKAITGLEFLQASENSVSNEAAVMEPLVRQFVREGYHNVPNWAHLGTLTRALILQKGDRDQNVADIAREAAIANGMSK